MQTETSSNPLVSSSDVDGTDVYGTGGDKVGHIDHLMIDKQSGKVAYAVMQFGGFMGMGGDNHPVPWGKLTYDTSKDGFVTDITKEQLEGAPSRNDDWDRDRAWEEKAHTYYGTPGYWI